MLIHKLSAFGIYPGILIKEVSSFQEVGIEGLHYNKHFRSLLVSPSKMYNNHTPRYWDI